MNSTGVDKGKPVADLYVVSLGEGSVALFSVDGIYTSGWSILPQRMVSGDHRGVYDQGAVLIAPHLLFGDADFHIGASDIIGTAVECAVQIDGITLSAVTVKDGVI